MAVSTYGISFVNRHFFSGSNKAAANFLRCWPIEPAGPLPRPIFEPEFVANAFFQALPKFLGCPSASVRKGLRRLFRDYVDTRAVRASAVLPLDRQDAELAMAACDHPKARARVNELEIVTESVIPHRGRSKVRRSVRSGRSFPPRIAVDALQAAARPSGRLQLGEVHSY